ncbi:nuclear transport factor 2 family protein [Rickettsiales bacterium]|nr:nuclear transport factor 2 family protein [Rickettsiales bacterium]
MNRIVQKYIKCYENINLSSAKEIMEYLDKDFYFSDPFNSIKGKKEFKSLFDDILKKIKNPKFKIINFSQNKSVFFIKWSFSGTYKKKFSFKGVSEIEIKNNLIIKHIDYWDSGKNFYCEIPLIGFLFKKIHK